MRVQYKINARKNNQPVIIRTVYRYEKYIVYSKGILLLCHGYKTCLMYINVNINIDFINFEVYELYFISKLLLFIDISNQDRTTSLCSHIFLVLRDHGVYMYVVYI